MATGPDALLPSLPYLGLGLTANLDGQAPPDPWALHAARPGLFDFVEYSAPLRFDPALWEGRAGLPRLFHPVHLNLWGPELESPEALALLDAQAREVGSPWVGNDVGWWHARGEPFPGYLYLAPSLDRPGLADAVTHARHVQAHLGVPLALENPAVIAVRGRMHVLDFMAELSAQTGAPLLLDLGHLFSHQLSRGLPPDAGFDGFPFERVVELHLAGGVVTTRGERRVYVDDHTQAVRTELFDLLEQILPRCTRLRALTFEGDGHPDPIAARTLERLRPRVPAPAGATGQTIRRSDGLTTPTDVLSGASGQTIRRSDGLTAPPEVAAGASGQTIRRSDGLTAPTASSGTWQPESDPVRNLLESYGREPCSEDPEGAAAELDYRLAVLAESLDRAFPVSRMLLAGTAETLAAFARSDDFTACFTEGTRTVPRAFAAWARARLRELPEPEAEAALALETAGMHGRLEEARFAARALRRHLTGRAWATGVVEPGGPEGLRQVVQRTVGSPPAPHDRPPD